jgi:ABC-type sugar transport system ATPase subunit
MTSQVQDTSSSATVAPGSPVPLLELKEITKSFPNRIHILGPISLVVKEGEFVVVIGPSGAGKSTLLRTITGFSDVTSGEVLYKGRRFLGVIQKQPWSFKASPYSRGSL